jgi:hypothetical protein
MNRKNLQKLATFLAYGKLPKEVEFDMSAYAEDPWSKRDTICGTVGCAAGMGPFAGIKKKRVEDWDDYCGRVFLESASREWDWCFGSSWQDIDNTPKGAARRIQYLLDKGVPDDFYGPRSDIKTKYARVKVLKPEVEA